MSSTSWSALTDKVVWITGGSRGIGFAAATEFATAGATVVLLGSTEESAHYAAESLVSKGLEVIGLGLNIADSAEVAHTVGNHPLAAGADVLINCAGVMSDKMAKTLRAT